MQLKEFFTYLSVQDSSKQVPAGYNERKKIALWSRKGKQFVSAEIYAEFVNNVKFDLVECLYDNQLGVIGDSKKQAKKSFDRFKQFIDAFYQSEQKLVKVMFVFMCVKSLRSFLD